MAGRGTTSPARAGDAVAPASSPLVRRMVTYVPGTVVPAVLTLATTVVFTRVFGPADYGVYSLLLAVATPVTLILTTWLTQSIGKFLPAAQTEQGHGAVKAAIALATAGSFVAEVVLGAVVLVLVRLVLPPDARGLLLPTLLFVVVTCAFEILSIVFPAEALAGPYVTYRLADSAGTFLLRLLLVSDPVGLGITAMFWSVVLARGALLPFMWRQLELPGPRRLRTALASPRARVLVRDLLGYGVPMTAWFLSSILLDVGDRYVLTVLEGPGAVGIYDVSYRLVAGLAGLMIVPVTITLHPYLMGLAASEDRARTGRVIGRVVGDLLVVGALCVGVVHVLHADLARVLLGPDFREGSVVMPIVLAGVLLFNIGTFAHKPFEIAGRTRTMVVMGLVAAATNLALCLALVPLVGYVGAAWATLLAYLVYTVGVAVPGRRLLPWRVGARRTVSRLLLVGSGVAAVGVLRAVAEPLPWPWPPLLAGAGCVVLGLLTLLTLRRGPAGTTG